MLPALHVLDHLDGRRPESLGLSHLHDTDLLQEAGLCKHRRL